MRIFILLVFLLLVIGAWWLWKHEGVGQCFEQGLNWDYRTHSCE